MSSSLSLCKDVAVGLDRLEVMLLTAAAAFV